MPNGKLENFEYNAETHEGFYNGKKIPSITQLLDCLFPLPTNIPEANLINAANRGTEIHAICEKINETFIDYGIKQASKVAYDSMSVDGINYYRFLATYGLVPYDYERLVFLLDENDDPFAYGHLDLIAKATKDIEIGGKVIYQKGEKVVHDIKTVASFEENKTKLQTELYRTAYNQTFGEQLAEKTAGIHLRDNKVKLYLFGDNRKDENIVKIAKTLLEIWNAKQ